MTSVDYHVHSSFSPDARDDMRKMVEKAVALNLEEIMFTDHFEFLSDGRPGRFCSSVDYIPRIVDEVIRLRDEYAGCIYVGLGLEIGQMQFAEKESKKIVNSYPFDFILASYHKVHDVEQGIKVHNVFLPERIAKGIQYGFYHAYDFSLRHAVNVLMEIMLAQHSIIGRIGPTNFIHLLLNY